MRLVSRNGHTFAGFDAVRAELARIVTRRAVLDGELVCLDEDGRPDFDALFYRRGRVYFYAFDVLMVGGDDLRDRPLLERKAILRARGTCLRNCQECLLAQDPTWSTML